MRVEIPFIGGAYLGRSKNLNSQVCQNLYPVVDGEGGKNVLALMNTPGLTAWCVTLSHNTIRGMHVMGEYLYAISGEDVYRIGVNADSLKIGTLNTHYGQVQMAADYAGNLMLVDDRYGYAITSGDVTEITDGDFPVPSSLTFSQGYFIVSKIDTPTFFISTALDPTTWDATETGSVDSEPYKLVRVVETNSILWMLGTRSTEYWYYSGASDLPFERNPGGVLEIGCSAPDSVATINGAVFWLDDTKRVAMSVGMQYQVVSTYQIEYQISQLFDYDLAVGFCYHQEGHSFYVLTFPKTGKTLCYDVNTGLWHTRASGNTDQRHRANCHALFHGKNLVGDYENGRIYEYDLGQYTDDGTTLRAVRTAQSVERIRKNTFHHELEIDFELGVGVEQDPDRDPLHGYVFGETEGINESTVPDSWPEATAAYTLFTDNCTDYGEESFESGFTHGQKPPFEVTFGGYITGNFTTVAGGIVDITQLFPPRPINRGRYPTDGNWYFDHSQLLQRIEFDEPVAGFGFFVTDASEALFPGQMRIKYYYEDGTGSYSFLVPHQYATSAGGGVFFVGFYDLQNDFSIVEFDNTVTDSVDRWGLDQMVVARRGDINSEIHSVRTLEPQAMLEWSDDGGHVWSNEHWTGIGKMGAYTHRAIWRRLGRSRERIYRVTVSDPVKRVIVSAYLDATEGRA